MLEAILAALNILVLVAVGIVMLFARKYLPTYVSKKAENLATKEDVGHITAIVEQIKTAHTADIERLKHELAVAQTEFRAVVDRVTHVHRVQFETEFRVLSEIWAALANVRARMGTVRPAMRVVNEGETDEQRLERTFDAFVKAKNEFVTKVDFSMPFYPATIHVALDPLIQVLGQEYLDVKTTRPEDRSAEWWARGAANFNDVCARAEQIAGMIRERLDSLVVT